MRKYYIKHPNKELYYKARYQGMTIFIEDACKYPEDEARQILKEDSWQSDYWVLVPVENGKYKRNLPSWW